MKLLLPTTTLVSFVTVLLLTAGCNTAPAGEDFAPRVDNIEAKGEGDEDEVANAACTEQSICKTDRPIPASKNNCVLMIGFDGSGVYSPSVGSNIGVLYNETVGEAARSGTNGLNGEVVDGETTHVYIEGVPALPFGASAERVDRGRSAICQHLATRASAGKAACDIVLLGYSRGAIIANQVAYVMDKIGCADGSHRGQRIAFLGGFDPVWKQMGSEWKDATTNTTHHWQGAIAANVERAVQVYKATKTDPRGGLDGLVLTTTLLDTAPAGWACNKPFAKDTHPEGKDWHHGEIGHGELPRNTIKCALAESGLSLSEK